MADDDELEYAPTTLRDLEQEIQAVRIKMLRDVSTEGAEPESMEFFLLAIGALEQAQRFMTLATYRQSKGLAVRQLGRCPR